MQPNVPSHYESTGGAQPMPAGDRKSTRLNSSHVEISYAVFCLKKKNKQRRNNRKKIRGVGRYRPPYQSFTTKTTKLTWDYLQLSSLSPSSFYCNSLLNSFSCEI